MTKYLLNIFALSFSIGLVILITLLVSKLLDKKYLIKCRCFLWIILSIRLLIPIGWDLPLVSSKYIDNHKNIIVHEEDSKVPLDYSSTKNIDFIQSLEENPKSGIKIKNNTIIPKAFKIVKIVYITGFIIFLTHQLIVYLVFKRKIFNLGQLIEDGTIIDNYQRINVELGLKRKVRILQCNKISTPILMGILRPTIIIPTKGYREKEIYYILKHELMHIKRRDLEYRLLILIANTIHWFNPLVHIMRNISNMDLEICCDLDVLKNQNSEEKKTYCKVLLSSIER